MGMSSYSKLVIMHTASIQSHLSFYYANFFTPRMNKNEPKVAMYDFFTFFGCILRDSICIYVTMSVSRLVGRLVGWSIGCSVGWSVGSSVGSSRSVCWSVSRSRVGDYLQQSMHMTGVVYSIHCILPCCFRFFIEHAIEL